MPIFILLMGSITNEEEIKLYISGLIKQKGSVKLILFPLYPTLRGYVNLLLDTPEFYVVFWNSVKIMFSILLGQLLVAVPCAWGFSRWHGRCSSILFYTYTILMLLPFQVTMLSNYIVLDQLGMLDTHSALIIPAIFSTFPVFILYQFFARLPSDIFEAFILDSNSRFQLFCKIGLPLASSGIKASMFLGIIEYWNMIEQPLLFIERPTLWPFSIYLPELNSENVQYSFVFSFMVLLPMLLLIIWGKDDLESGIGAMTMRK
jgi:multiple sugar transport system permease protein